MSFLLNDNSPMVLLNQTGNTKITCAHCGVVGVPSIEKSHINKITEDQLYKVTCAYCCKYHKFINEHQKERGIYERL